MWRRMTTATSSWCGHRDSGKTGPEAGVFAQRFVSGGARLGYEFQVNTYTTTYQIFATVAMNGAGDFVVAWTSYGQDGGLRGVFAQRFASSGAPLGGEFQVNSSTLGNQEGAHVAIDDDGDFVVVWWSSPYGTYSDALARRFSSAGSPVGAELQIELSTAQFVSATDVAMDADGDFIVIGLASFGAAQPLLAQRFSSTGVAQDLPPLIVSPTGAGIGRAAFVADGGFVVVWESADGDDSGVFARTFASTGLPLDDAFLVNEHTIDRQAEPDVAIDAIGDFVVTWAGLGQDGSSYGVFRRSFSSAGTATTHELQVNSHTPTAQHFPAVAMSDEGDFVIAWSSGYGQDGSLTGIFAQRFAEQTLDVDCDGAAEPLTDAILVLRYLFGFRGAALLVQAVNLEGCSRCAAADIEDHLAATLIDLDADGDGQAAPLSDGVLILRFLFGFHGPPLVAGGVVAASCSRCTATAIADYLDTLLD
jgi:hypothetical protein